MKCLRVILSFFFLFFFFNGISADTVLKLSQINEFADGLNIEGGTVAHEFLHENQIWANICTVLDRPYQDGIEWIDITNKNKYPLKETSIPSFNEAQVNYAHAVIMHYYLTHAHRLSNKPLHENVNIIIQVHRNTSGPRQVKLLDEVFEGCYSELDSLKVQPSHSNKYHLFTNHYPSLNVSVHFYYGVEAADLAAFDSYKDSDIVISVSLIAGLRPHLNSGHLVVPSNFQPFSLKNFVLSPQLMYHVQNHLLVAIPEIIKEQSQQALETVNQKYRSANPIKSHLFALPLINEDFKQAVILHVDGIFNPSLLSETFILRSE